MNSKTQILVSLLLFSALSFFSLALVFGLVSPPVYAQTADAWNIHRQGAGNDLNFYYSLSGLPALKLNTNGQMRARAILDINGSARMLDLASGGSSNLNALTLNGALNGTTGSFSGYAPGITGNALQVAGTSAATSQNQLNITPAAGTWGFILGSNNSSAPNSGYHCPSCAHVINYNNANLNLGTSNSVRMSITGAGNVGIGTTLPGNNLEVSGIIEAMHQAGGYETLQVQMGTVSPIGYPAIGLNANIRGGTNLMANSAAARGIGIVDAGGNLHISSNRGSASQGGTWDPAGANTNLFINGADGNVGIGTVSTAGTRLISIAPSSPATWAGLFSSPSYHSLYATTTAPGHSAAVFNSANGHGITVDYTSYYGIITHQYNDNSTAGAIHLWLQEYSVARDDTYFIYTTSDANGNQAGQPGGGNDTRFYVTTSGKVRADKDIVGGGADVAEWTPTADIKALGPGDLVVVDGSSKDSLTKKAPGITYDATLMGIVSTNPGLVSGGGAAKRDPSKTDVLVALAGRVPTKVSTENGPIQPGDYLTSSSAPGVAMKATKPGMTVGKALESFNDSGIGKIEVFVDATWYDPNPITTRQKLDSQQQQIDGLKKEIEELKSQN